MRHPSFVLLLALLTLPCTSVRATVPNASAPVFHPDYDALVAFYNAMNGPNWTGTTGWAEGVAGDNCNVCSWSNVTCVSNRVVALTFGVNHNLDGNFPAELGDLDRLRTFTVRNNLNAGGTLPATFFSNTAIERIDFRDVGLTGLPANVGDATNLNYLRLINANDYSGPIPASIAQLAQLETFYISGADITAPLPAGFGGTVLRVLRIQNTTIPGPLPDLTGLTGLEFVDITDNPNLNGNPPDLSNATGLRTFNANDNAFTGVFPASGPDDYNLLTTFNVDGNALSGNAPALPGASALLSYDISENGFSGTITEPLFPSTLVDLIDVGNNDFSGPLPPFFADSNPQTLRVNNNNFGGCYPPEWAVFCGTVGEKNFTVNPGLPANGNINWFQDNVCDLGRLCDDCHPDFAALVTLYNATNGPDWTDQTGWEDGAVGADCNVCTWAGVTCVAGRVTELDLDQSGLVGFVPDNIGELTELTELRLSRNDFAGSTLPDLSPLSNLQVLRLNGSAFGGNLPVLGSMVNLATLNLADNAFTGPIPMAYDTINLPAIAELYLNDNQLSGALPATLGDLFSLEEFIAHDNDLSGDYPSSFANFCGLVLTEFFNNPDLPDGGSDDYFSNTFCLALPVTWVEFTATARQKSVNLIGTTAAEGQNAGFTVQRSGDGRNWRDLIDLAPVPADATGLHHYTHTDLNPPAGDLLYRIRQADFDGTVSYSPVRRVTITGSSASVAPNPAGGDFTISSPTAQTVMIYSTDGRRVSTIAHSGARTQVRREELRSGVYWLRFSASGEAVKLVIR